MADTGLAQTFSYIKAQTVTKRIEIIRLQRMITDLVAFYPLIIRGVELAYEEVISQYQFDIFFKHLKWYRQERTETSLSDQASLSGAEANIRLDYRHFMDTDCDPVNMIGDDDELLWKLNVSTRRPDHGEFGEILGSMSAINASVPNKPSS